MGYSFRLATRDLLDASCHRNSSIDSLSSFYVGVGFFFFFVLGCGGGVLGGDLGLFVDEVFFCCCFLLAGDGVEFWGILFSLLFLVGIFGCSFF